MLIFLRNFVVMKQENNGFTPFKQIPTWSDDETFTMTGKQVAVVQKMCEMYSEFMTGIEPFFIENLNNGKITIRYEDLEGNPLQKEDIDEMLKQYAQRLASQFDVEPNIGE